MFTGWALILREVDPTGPARKLWNEWNAASKFWDEVAKQEKDEYLQALSDQLIERSQTQMKNDENPKPKPKRAAQQPRPNKP